MDINEIIQKLSTRRPIFHSQTDFREALTTELQWNNLQCSVNKELGRKLKTDIWAVDKQTNKIYAIEVKYRTAFLVAIVNDADFKLKMHSANDQARYDFIEDIVKLERIVKSQPNVECYSIFITNDRLYWEKSKREGTVDEQFQINDGKLLSGQLKWGHGASDGTKGHRIEPLVLENKYQLEWQIYSMVSSDKHGTFKVLVVKVQ